MKVDNRGKNGRGSEMAKSICLFNHMSLFLSRFKERGLRTPLAAPAFGAAVMMIIMTAAPSWAYSGAASPASARPIPAEATAADMRERTRIAAELITLTGIETMISSLATQTAMEIITALRAPPSDQVQAILHRTLNDVFSANSHDLIKRMLPIYTETFTATELRDIIAFYRSPTGEKSIRTMPFLLERSIAAGKEWAAALQPEMTKAIEQEMRRHGYR